MKMTRSGLAFSQRLTDLKGCLFGNLPGKGKTISDSQAIYPPNVNCMWRWEGAFLKEYWSKNK
jgi:hypothetical protein